jgi:inhibitor of cysteine peptidase
MKSLLLISLALGWLSTGLAAERKPIVATVGQNFKIALESNPSSGYQWLLAKPLDETLLKQAGKSYDRRAPNSTGTGCEWLMFQAIAEGKTEIHLKYDRLWEQTAAPARRTNFVVVITKSAAK